MPRKKKPKAGDEAACPQCRKLVALVQTDGGALVLRVHHVVANGGSGNGYDVNECGSSGHPPASPSEVAEGDRWQDKAPQRPGKPTAIGSTAMRAATIRQTVDVDAMTGAVSSATEGVSSLGEAIREATESIVRAAAATQDDFALTEEHVLTTEQMADVMRASINGYAVRQMMSTSTVPPELLADIDPESMRSQVADAFDVPRDVIGLAPDMPMAARRTAMRHAARDLRDALQAVLADVTGQQQTVYIRPEPDGRGGAQLRGHIQPDGFQFATHVPAAVLADPVALDDLIRRASAEARTQLERRFRPARFTADGGPRIGDMSSADQPWSVDQANLVAAVLTAIRETYIDVTGAPPTDADVSMAADHPDVFTQNMQVLRLRLQPGDLVLQVPIYGQTLDMPGAAETLAREAAAAVRSALLRRGPGGRRECRNRHGVCTCTLPADHADRHLCACRTAWREPEADACP